MIYKGIETEDKWNNGSWFTIFSMNGSILKTVEWNSSFDDDGIRKVIDRETLPFV